MSTSVHNKGVGNTIDPHPCVLSVATNSVPPLSSQPLPASAPAMSQPKQASVSMPTDAAIEVLLEELRVMARITSPDTAETKPVTPQAMDAGDVLSASSLGRMIDNLFDEHLASLREIKEAEARTHSLHAAVTMLAQLEGPKRNDARAQIAAAIAEAPQGKDAERLFARLLDDLIAAHTDTRKAVTAAAAEQFARTLSAAISKLPFPSLCKLLTMQMWAAKRLDVPSMAQVSIDAFVPHVIDDDLEVTAKRIEQAAHCIDVIPVKLAPMVVMALYQCIPDQAPWQLRSLEALAAKDTPLPETDETWALIKIIHQQVYELRIAAAQV